MFSTHCSAHLAVLSFETVSDWKLSFNKLTFSLRLTRLLRLISLAHWATEFLFSLAQEQNLLTQAIGPGFFPALTGKFILKQLDYLLSISMHVADSDCALITYHAIEILSS